MRCVSNNEKYKLPIYASYDQRGRQNTHTVNRPNSYLIVDRHNYLHLSTDVI